MYPIWWPLKNLSNQPLRSKTEPTIFGVSQNVVVFFNKDMFIIKSLLVALPLMKTFLGGGGAVMPFGRWYKLTINCKMVCKKKNNAI